MLGPPPVGEDGNSDDGEDDLIPATIYQRLDLIENRMETYALFAAAEDDSYEEVSEDEEGLDLTAPPPES